MSNMKTGNFKPLKLKEPITVNEAAKIYGGHYTSVIRHIELNYFTKVDRSTDRILLEKAEVVQVYKTKSAANGKKINGPIQGKTASPTSIELKPETYYMCSMLAKKKNSTVAEFVETILADVQRKLFKEAKL